MRGYDILDALGAIDPSSLDYSQWLEVGQALHHEGYGSDVWRDWSRTDAARFDERDFERKWRGFGASANPVTGGTIVKMARDAGWKPKPEGGWTVFEWDSEIGSDKPIADGTIAAGDVLEPYDAGLSGEGQAKAYIDALFEPDEYICYVTEAKTDKDGKWKVGGRGTCHRTAGEVSKALAKGRFEDAIGTYNEQAGVWCCFNPLDGEGRNNTNVSAYRYILVESDETEPAVCKSVYEQLNLPIAAMVYSGRRSLHAIVRVDAADLSEYNERRDAIYKACEDNGLSIDRSNKNAARLSRLPGVVRGSETQYLVSLACGAGDFEEWQEWYEAANDDLPDVVSLEEAFTNPEALNPELIKGVLRVGHKMLLSGPSKAGKSFLLLLLAIAFAEGWEWLGFECRKSRVLYVNLEVDPKSFKKRFSDVYDQIAYETGRKRRSAGSVMVWNLRGKAQPLNRLLPKLVRRCRDNGIEVVIIDPIYKVMTGDENSAADMAAFTNSFDALCDRAGVSVIYSHHHSKGYQFGKRSIDRASGSGVFGRDPDAILDLIELDAENYKWSRVNGKICDGCARIARRAGLGEWWESLEKRDREVEANAMSRCREKFGELDVERAEAMREKCVKSQEALTAWRIEATLREFPKFKPVDAWFDWPVFAVDGDLEKCSELGADEWGPARRGKGKGKKQKTEADTAAETIVYKGATYDEINDAIDAAAERCREEGLSINRTNIAKFIEDLRNKKGEFRSPSVSDVANWTVEKKEWCRWVPGEIDETSKKGARLLVRRDTV